MLVSLRQNANTVANFCGRGSTASCRKNWFGPKADGVPCCTSIEELICVPYEIPSLVPEKPTPITHYFPPLFFPCSSLKLQGIRGHLVPETVHVGLINSISTCHRRRIQHIPDPDAVHWLVLEDGPSKSEKKPIEQRRSLGP
jgi:hypothetical protein